MIRLLNVALNDLRLVFRDNSLKIFIALPLLTLPVIIYGVPYVAAIFPVIHDHIEIILMLASMQGSIAFGFIYSMVIVDEKDTSVAKVYGILPLSKFWFVIFRLIPPFLLATLATFLLLLVEPFYGLPLLANLAYSTLAGLVAPIMTLVVATFATNKIEAMTWQKLFNTPLFLPIFAFFIPFPFSAILAIFPAYWAYQGFDLLVRGGSAWLYLLIGFAYSIAVIALMTMRFTKKHFR